MDDAPMRPSNLDRRTLVRQLAIERECFQLGPINDLESDFRRFNTTAARSVAGRSTA